MLFVSTGQRKGENIPVQSSYGSPFFTVHHLRKLSKLLVDRRPFTKKNPSTFFTNPTETPKNTLSTLSPTCWHLSWCFMGTDGSWWFVRCYTKGVWHIGHLHNDQVKVILVGGLGNLPSIVSSCQRDVFSHGVGEGSEVHAFEQTNNRFMMGQWDMSLSSRHYPEIAIPSTSSISFKLFMKQTLPQQLAESSAEIQNFTIIMHELVIHKSTSSARTSRGRKFPKGKELYSTERICL